MAQQAVVYPPVAGPLPPARRLTFHGDGLTLLGIYLVNALLTIVTLGIYYFWARTRVRAYLLSQAEFEGDRFAWHGTGKELLVGFLKIVGFVVVALGAAVLIQVLWDSPLSDAVITAGIYAFILLIAPLATIGSRRYRLSRVSWRGIRFSFRGKVREFMRIYVGGMLLNGLTFGLYYPIFHNNTRRYLVDRSYFGTTRFGYDGEGGPLFKRFLLTILGAFAAAVPFWVAVGVWAGFRARTLTDPMTAMGAVLAGAVTVGFLLTAVVIGIAWASYAAFRHRYYWSHTTVATARFASTMTAWKIVSFVLTNLLLLGVTAGIALPWVVVRNMKFAFANVALEGPLDLAAIQQDAQAAAAAGEALGDLLGLDFFDIDLGI